MTFATPQAWLSMTREELDEIYSKAKPGPIPTGDTRGTAIVTGSLLPRTIAHIARLLAWQGKVFDIFADNGNSGVLINKITPFSLSFIVAKVYRGKSWMDQQDTIVIDYSKTSFFAKVIRDEIRQIEPGLYLGKVWIGKTRMLDFALSCPEQLKTSSTGVEQSHNEQSKASRQENTKSTKQDKDTIHSRFADQYQSISLIS